MHRLLRLARASEPPTRSDVVGAGVVLIWALLEAVLATGPGSTAARVGFALAVGLPLLVRRRLPLAVIVFISGVTVAWATNADRAESGTVPFPAILLALFSVALFARSTPRAGAGLAVAVTAMLITIHSPFYDTTPTAGNTAILIFFSSGTWTAGWLVRRRVVQVRQAYEESGDLARSAVAEERARIARELHDVVAHSISIVAVQAGAAEALIDQDVPAAREHMAAVRRTARETMTEMRRLLGVLREDDATYAPQPGLARLPDLIDDVRRAGIDVELTEEGQRRELPPGVDLVAYRVIQESLTNVRKHAGGAAARVVVSHAPAAVTVEVANGPAARMGVSPNGSGHGLIGMRERVRIFGGRFEAGATAGGGYRVSAVLPLEDESR